MPQPILIVSGPTASGKSQLAMRLAQRLNGELVNVDSVQVYRELDIGSAKPGPAELERIPHHLVSIREPSEQYHAKAFLEDADRALSSIRERGRQPIAVGGTSLYITALLHGLAELPAADLEFRSECESLSNEDLFAQLQSADPAAAARLHPNDRLRVIRALESVHVLGVATSAAHSKHAYRELRMPALILVPCWPRSMLYERIDRRARDFLSAGLVEETRAVIERHGACAPGLRTLGYAQARAFLDGAIPEQALAGEIAMHTRRFAKRQMTYWRNEPPKRGWMVRPSGDEGRVVDPGSSKALGLRALELSADELEGRLVEWLASGAATVEVWYLDAAACLAS